MKKIIKLIWVYFIPSFIKNFIKLLCIKFKFGDIIIDYSTIRNLEIDNIVRLFTFGKKTQLGKNIQILGKFVLENYSYIGSGSIISGNEKYGTTIGKYCSIADNLYIVSVNNHYMNLMSTNDRILNAIGKKTKITGGNVLIGNDVWIGANVTILYGIKVGDGVVIGANSVITKDIPAYAIVVGNPGKVIKYRFNEEQRDYLLKNEWFNLEEKNILNYYIEFNKKFNIDDGNFLTRNNDTK